MRGLVIEGIFYFIGALNSKNKSYCSLVLWIGHFCIFVPSLTPKSLCKYSISFARTQCFNFLNLHIIYLEFQYFKDIQNQHIQCSMVSIQLIVCFFFLFFFFILELRKENPNIEVATIASYDLELSVRNFLKIIISKCIVSKTGWL